MLWILQEFPPPAALLRESFTNLKILQESLLFLHLQSSLPQSFERIALYFLTWASYANILNVWRSSSSWKFPARIFREYDGQLSKPCEKSVSNALKIHEALCYLRIVFLSSLCEEAYYCSSDTMINCEARNAERKNRIENSILEYMKKSTKRVHEEDHEEVLKNFYAMENRWAK